jgi:hypothetical protein
MKVHANFHVRLFCFDNIKRRSLSYHDDHPPERNILMNMEKAGYLTHVRRLNLNFYHTPAENGCTLEDLANIFDFSRSLTDLTIRMGILYPEISVKMTSFPGMASKLKKGFGRLERVELENCSRRLFLNSWSVYQEILT